MTLDQIEGRKDYVRISVGLPRSFIKGKDENGATYEYRWYRSKDKISKMKLPFGSYMLNKKWTLEEEFNNHMLRFQQVNMRVIYPS